MNVRIKFCGITRAVDAEAAATTGADAIGLVFAPGSARRVTPHVAAAICLALPPFVTRVGVFVDPSADEVHQALRAVHLDVLQFHGVESATFCSSFGVPYVKAVRVRDAGDIRDAAQAHPAARALLLDAFVAGQPGGTGVTFPWQLVPAGTAHPVILAGGLDETNVGAAIAAVRPWAVDVSGGVEERPGIKDMARMQRFVAAVRAAAGAGTALPE